jgi:hypothetical protein
MNRHGQVWFGLLVAFALAAMLWVPILLVLS